MERHDELSDTLDSPRHAAGSDDSPSTVQQVLPIRVITHNIRYAPAELSAGEAPWRTRLPLLASQFRYHSEHNPYTFICMQELLCQQLTDLLTMLNASSPTFNAEEIVRPEWAYIGVGRKDGQKAGEHCAIFYRPSAWELLSTETHWLSKTPAVPGSKYPGAGSPRLVTMGRFVAAKRLANEESPRRIVVANTHLDNASEEARKYGAEMLNGYIDRWCTGGTPVILTGDLNSTDTEAAYTSLAQSRLKDVRLLTDKHYGETNTFTGFKGRKKDFKRIDYIFAGQWKETKHQTETIAEDKTWTVDGYAVLPNRFEDDGGVYSSDHRAVVVDLSLHSVEAATKSFLHSLQVSLELRMRHFAPPYLSDTLFLHGNLFQMLDDNQLNN